MHPEKFKKILNISMPGQNTARIAATDYDGTLYLQGEVSAHTLAVVRDWRQRGNLFGLVTGRDLGMIRHEIERWRIPFDFLICCNGATLYNAGFHELQRRDIPTALIRPILAHPMTTNSFHCEFSVAGFTHLWLRSPKSRFSQLGVPYLAITETEALAMDNVQLVSLAFADAEAGTRCVETIDRDFGAELEAHQNGPNVDITARGIDKAQGLRDLLRIMDWSEERLLVIGDAENDLPMIRQFQGYSLFSAQGNIQQEAKAIYHNVAEMLTSASSGDSP